MGNNSLSEHKDGQQLIIDPPHSMLNNTKVLNKDGRAILRAEWPFFNKEIYLIWEKQYKAFLQQIFQVQSLLNVRQPLSKHLLLPLNYHYTEVNVCTPTGIVTMQYDLPGRSLIADIEERSLKNEPYQEHQIWILVFQLSKIVSFLQQQSIAAGDIRSQNLFIDFGQKNLKMATEVSWIGQPKFANKIAENSDVFLAPQVLLQKKQNKQLKRSMFKSNDDFCIGMTIAECILLQDLSKLYEVRNAKRMIDKQKILELTQRLLRIKYYSLKLLLVVIGMIQTKPMNRISCHQVCQLLKHSKKEIVACLPFELTRQQFLRQIPDKYKVLETIMEETKLKTSRLLFDHKEGYSSRILSIASISAIKNDKRAQDTTFNYEPVELSINSNYKPTQVTHFDYQKIYPQKDYTIDNHDFKQLSIKQNPQNQYEAKPEKTDLDNFQTNSGLNHKIKRKNSGSSGKKLEYLKLDQIWATSDSKLYGQPLKCSTVPRQLAQFSQKEEMKESDPQITSNFSFHGPESLIKPQFQVPEQENYDEIQHQTAINKIQNDSSSKSTETLLLMPSVYNVSNPPESYISYHYTKSIAPNDRKNQEREDKDECMSFETKFFHFEKELPDNVMLRKKSQESYAYQDRFQNNGSSYKRSTLGANCSGQKFGRYQKE